MPRDLDRRFEVVAPVEPSELQQRIRSFSDVMLADNTTAWELQSDARWQRLHPKKDEPPRGTHAVLMKSARPRARRRAASLRRKH